MVFFMFRIHRLLFTGIAFCYVISKSCFSEENTYYVGAQLGIQSSTSSDIHTGHLYGVKGGVDFNDNIGLVLDYKKHQIQDPFKIKYVSGKAKFRHELFDNINIFDEIGVAYLDVSFQQNFSFVNEFGLSYFFNKNLSSSISYQYLNDIRNNIVDRFNNHAILLGFNYTFDHEERKPIFFEDDINFDCQCEPDRLVEPFNEVNLETFFSHDSDALSDDTILILKRAIDILTEFRNSVITVSGHTNNIGSDAYNNKLAKRRAEKIANYIMQQGISSERITIKSSGKSNPLYSNSNQDGLMKNRRVDLHIFRGDVL